GARAGACCIPDYARLLAGTHGETLARQVRQVVVVGRPTLSRSVQALIARAPALAVAGFGARWSDAPAHAESVLPAVPASWLERTPGEAVDRGWLEQWRAAAEPTPAESWGPRAIAAAFAVAVGAGIGVVGSSGPVRALDRVLPAAAPGAAPTLIANRGLAGIDGTVSTAVGVALATRRPVLALMGDVTFLHDAGGLLVGPREERPRLRIVVVNDGGGTIFAGLEHAAASAADVERVFTTPHGAHLAALCEAYRVPHLSVASQEGLTAALAAPCDGLEVIEAVL
ncbi:2-succinyl-5-enolpyruvyl-6-hydroxy-3-cyclohexene-1-carboxylate synthase, partial [Demequina sp.]|uniref:2-succinyl-5-enolpyruvyl-6-hydroxy-3- cyclohexene-1-carboxylate synthase n=1 Tax=Demequina sp. TaxID=2050685 RepID=UPI0025CF1D2F